MIGFKEFSNFFFKLDENTQNILMNCWLHHKNSETNSVQTLTKQKEIKETVSPDDTFLSKKNSNILVSDEIMDLKPPNLLKHICSIFEFNRFK